MVILKRENLKVKKILIISYSPIARDPRILRQIEALENKYDISVCGYGEKPHGKNIAFYPVPHPVPARGKTRIYKRANGLFNALLKRFEVIYWNKEPLKYTLHCFEGTAFDLIVANDLEALPVALRLAGDGPVLFDAHEFYPGQFGRKHIFYNEMVKYFCKRCIPKARKMMTVCDGIANEYKRLHSVEPVVVTNAPDYEDLAPNPLDPEIIRIVHHGGAIESRRIETMIQLMDYLDDKYTLDFLLLPTQPEYYAKLKRSGSNNKKIRFLDPVKTSEIATATNKYDIGLYILKPGNFNQKHALPNKFFEFIQARLAVAIGPSPEMAKIVRENDLGVVAKDFAPESLAEEIKKLTAEDIMRFKRNSHKVAKELSAQKNKATIARLAAECLEDT